MKEKRRTMSRGYYVCIPLVLPGQPDTGAHVTIALRANCSPGELQLMINDMKTLQLPIVLTIDPNVEMFGQKKDIPVHRVHFAGARARETIESIYGVWYRQEDGLVPHSAFEAHVSVDNPTRAAVVNTILSEEYGGVHVAKTLVLKRIGGGREILFSIGN